VAKKRAKKAAKKAAKKKAAKRGAPKKRPAAKKAAPRRARKTSARSSKPRKAAKRAAKKSASRSAKRSRATRAAKRAPRKRPALALVKRPAPKPAPKPRAAKVPAAPPFAGASAGASAKDLLMFELVRARVAVHAALQGMVGSSAEIPIAPGKRTTRQLVLHLAYWDREILKRLEDMMRHDIRPPEWSEESIERMNDEAMVEMDTFDWEAAKRLLHTQRERLLETLQSFPEEPSNVWNKPHAVEWILRILIHHDRHHADQIRDARMAREGGPGR